MESERPGLRVTSLVAGYDAGVPVLNGIDFLARSGEITGVIGPNGSGKSTLLNAVCGFASRFSGKVELNGRDLSRLAPAAIARAGIAYVAQDRAVFPFLSVLDNLELAGWQFAHEVGDRRKRTAQVFEWFPVLYDKRHENAGVLSGGEQRQLEFARTVMREAVAILFDEPTTGLSPKIATELYAMIREMKQPGRSIVVVDQNVKAVLAISDTAYELRNGVPRRLDPSSVDARMVVGTWLE